MHTSWVVVADAARARLFVARGAFGALEEVADLVHPDSRRPAHVAGPDAPGRSYDRFGGARHAMAGHAEKKAIDVRDFAHEISEYLAQGREAGEFNRLYLLAEPRMLGALRPALDDATRACVVEESACDLVPQSLRRFGPICRTRSDRSCERRERRKYPSTRAGPVLKRGVTTREGGLPMHRVIRARSARRAGEDSSLRNDSETTEGACHCGGVRFRVRLGDALGAAFRCDCSYCGMRGAVAVPVDLDDLELIAGEALLSAYRFGTHTACHYFCSRCGIHTHYRRRSNPRQYGVNAACLTGVGPFDFAAVPVTHGRIHPADRDDGRRAPRAGTLRFVPASD